jgi:hypothetical protein
MKKNQTVAEKAALLRTMARTERADAKEDLRVQHDPEDTAWKVKRAVAMEAGARALLKGRR